MNFKTKIIGLFISFALSQGAYAQKIDGKLKAFYKTFQESIRKDDMNTLSACMYFPFQTIYWIDGINKLNEEEKADGLIGKEEFTTYAPKIYHPDVKRLIPKMGIEHLQQIDIESSGDYYRQLANAVDGQDNLYELYCQYSEDSTVGDDYFAFIFGKVNNEYKVLAYYSKWRVKE
jgi:hypothetical protein